MSAELQFLGATGTVTGSKYLLRINSKNILVDCGLFQGLKLLRLRNWSELPVKPHEIDAVVLTHAHIDHSGYLPVLVKHGFRGNIFCTPATKALCSILLPDSGHLQEEDALYLNKHQRSKHHPALPLYTEKEAVHSLSSFREVPWKKNFSLTPEVSFEFHPAGHILGASYVRFHLGKTLLTFSGDLGRLKNLIMNPPDPLLETRYLVVESTYGDRQHPQENPKEVLKQLVQKTIHRGGSVLIPTFAVGRAQEVLYLLKELKKEGSLPEVPVYLNSPMATQATQIFSNFVGEHALTAQDVSEMQALVKFVASVEESKKLNELQSPSIILSASGMATGGRVLHHLKSMVSVPQNLVLFVGFQAAGTRGEAMIHGAERIKIHGDYYPVRAEVVLMESLSAHADADEIVCWLRNARTKPQKIFITHGEPLASEALRKKIDEELGLEACVPDYLEKVLLK